MDAENVGMSHGEAGIDHSWKRKLEKLFRDTPLASSLEEAVQPLAYFQGEIDFEDVMANVEGQREVWEELLYSPDGPFKLPRSYPLDFAVAIYLYTLQDPAVFSIINREMFNPARRTPGAGSGISEGLRKCMPFVKYLFEALNRLPEEYVFVGTVWRGVKWVFPSTANHDPEGYFANGQILMWYEFKSTSTELEVMTREGFCGVRAGPRTIFKIKVTRGWRISKFSYFRDESEVLLPPLTMFKVLLASKTIIDPRETASLERSGFPDTVHLQQLDAAGAAAPAGAQQAGAGQAQQEQADAALARALQEALDLERNTAPPAQGQGGAGAATSTIQVKGKCAHCGRDVLGTQQRGRGLDGEYFHADPGDCAPAPAAGQHSVPSGAAAGPGPTLRIERGSGGSVGLRFRRPQGRAAGPFEIIAIEPHGPAALSGLGVCMCVCVHAWKSDTQTRACTRACTRTHMRARAHTHKLPHAHTHAQRPATTFAR